MIWMLHRVQPRLFWTAILGGISIACGHLQANGAGDGAGTGGTVNGTVAASANGAHASGGERSSAPAEVGRVSQPAAPGANREVRVQTASRERVEGGNQAAIARGPQAAPEARVAATGVAPNRNVGRNGNTWSDPAGGQPQRYYGGYANNNRQNGYRRPSRNNLYLYQYYGGYYPVYVDVPVYVGSPDLGPGPDASYDGGPTAATDSSNSGGPVAAPAASNGSPQTDDGQPAANGAAGNAAAPDAALASNHSPNPSLGPDSLVEAVQAELTRRGYFQGKVDAMFRADTEAAIRHFQQDNYLAPTGHLNEATLHALNLD